VSTRFFGTAALLAVVCCLTPACSGERSNAQSSNDNRLQTALRAASKITPSIATLTISQTQQFTVNPPAGVAVTWSVDGVVGGNGAVGTISATGLYVPPATAGVHSVTANSTADKSLVAQGAVAVTDLSGVYTYHNDTQRTGQNLKEYALTPTTVGSAKFGKRWSCAVDGEVYAQPLYVANMQIGGGTHNVVIVATQHDSIYALDADDPGCHAYWQVSLLGPGVTSLPIADTQCNAVLDEVGILSTPVIDPATNVLYLVAATKENGSYIQRMHAINVTDGSGILGSPVIIQASINNAAGDTINFVPINQMQRGALALSAGGIYITWASYCDLNDYWGWIMRYDKTSLTQTAVMNTAPNGVQAAIWMSGGAPAIDSSGSLYFTTGNGSFNNTAGLVPPTAPNNNFGESFLKVDPATLSVMDFYTPSRESTWSSEDEDISSSGVTVLPDGQGGSTHPNLLVGADKQAHIWIIDRSNMQQYHGAGDPVVQFLNLPGCLTPSACVYSTQAYWNGFIYVAVNGGSLMALPIVSGLFPADIQNTAKPSSQSKETYGHPSPVPAVSASPAGNAIVWVLDNSWYGAFGSPGYAPAVLRAYDASDLGNTLYSSSTVAGDASGFSVKFTLPVVANGHVYVGGGKQLTVYGLAP